MTNKTKTKQEAGYGALYLMVFIWSGLATLVMWNVYNIDLSWVNIVFTLVVGYCFQQSGIMMLKVVLKAQKDGLVKEDD